MDILIDEKPKTIKLLDGKEYVMPVMHLTTLANMQKTMGFKFTVIKEKMDEDAIEGGRLLVYAMLKENYPDITLEQAGCLVSVNMIAELTSLITFDK